MATTIQKYVSKCEEVLNAKPAYVHGKSSLTECDCIGMSKYAFRENNVPFSTTGTNFSARQQVDNLRKLKSVDDLHVGDVVFKAREQGEAGWELDKYPKYMPGGKYYNGDLRDYYHIGTVKSVYPLQIIHMTSPTAKTDDSIVKWGFAGTWKKEYISDANPDIPEPAPYDPEPEPAKDPVYMVVFAENGKPVNMRTKPSMKAALIDKVPVGCVVEKIGDDGAGWANIIWNKKRGWMMECFLVDEYTPTPDPDEGDDPTDEPGETLTVWSENGLPVKLRKKPSTLCNIYEKLPVGTEVELVKYGVEWTQVNYKQYKGWYMTTKFLSRG